LGKDLTNASRRIDDQLAAEGSLVFRIGMNLRIIRFSFSRADSVVDKSEARGLVRASI
jgi:hypothetical protein